MDEQQQFRPGDRVKVTTELTVVDVGDDFHIDTVIDLRDLHRRAEQDHVTVELVERAKPPREPGLHLCAYDGRPVALRWDGEKWHWPGLGDGYVLVQDKVTVIGSIDLNEGVEL